MTMSHNHKHVVEHIKSTALYLWFNSTKSFKLRGMNGVLRLAKLSNFGNKHPKI